VTFVRRWRLAAAATLRATAARSAVPMTLQNMQPFANSCAWLSR
jgi:hypothetical protein